MSAKNYVHSDSVKTVVQRTFGGFNRTEGACDGDIYDCFNMSSRHYPVLSSRGTRYERKALSLGTGMELRTLGAYDVADRVFVICTSADGSGRLWVLFLSDDSGVLYAPLPFTSDGGKVRAAVFNRRLVIFCQSKAAVAWYDGDKGEIAVERIDFSFESRIGVYHSAAEQTTYIQLQADAAEIAKIRTGDVYFFSCSYSSRRIERSFKVHRIREISDTLVIIETDHDPEIPENAAGLLNLEEEFDLAVEYYNADIERRIPALECVCTSSDRIWGCSENRIYACTSADPFNWYDYDISTSARAFFYENPSVSDYVGAVDYLGDVFFFTVEDAWRMYGTTPEVFKLVPLCTYGCEKNSGGSFGIVSGLLYYNSPKGPVCFDGESARLISAPFGDEEIISAFGIGCGECYYMCMGGNLYVYDSRYRAWNKEPGGQIGAMVVIGGELVAVKRDTSLFYLTEKPGTVVTVEEEKRASTVEFADFFEGTAYGVTAHEFSLCISLSEGARLLLYISYGGEEFSEIWSTDRIGKYIETVRFVPKEHADYYRLRLVGTGEWKLYSLVRSYIGHTNNL